MKKPRRMSACSFLRLFAAAALSWALAAPLALPQQAAADEGQRVVRVGYLDSAGMLTRAEDGTFSGYTYDYLIQVAQYTGWTYEFIEASGSTENERATNLVGMLEDGTVDIEGSMTYSTAYAELYEYPRNSYGTVRTALFVPDGTSELTQTNLFTRDSIKVALYKTSKMRRAELEYFCQQNGLGLEMIECDSLEEMQQLTADGETDAFLDIDLNVREGFHVVAAFAARPFYFAAPHGQRDIVDELDATIKLISQSDPSLQTNLSNKYFLKLEGDLSLTQEELAFARSHEPLRVGVLSEKAPIQSFDEKTGELNGVTRGVLDYLTKHAGLSFEVVPIERGDDMAQSLRNADVDLVAGIDARYSVAAKLGMSVSAPYLEAASLVVYNRQTNPDDLESARLAVPWELSSLTSLRDNVEVYGSLEECIDAVKDGRANFTYANSYTAPYYMNLTDSSNLLTLPMSASTSDTAFGLMRPVEPELLLIINKSLRSLPAAELDSIIYDSALIDQDEQAGAFFRTHAVELALAAIGVLIVIIVLLALYLRARMRERKALSDRAHHDGLTGLLNWETFRERAEELLLQGRAGALVVVDMDDFKNVNDTYGHLAGDVALQRTSEMLRRVFRPQDLIGRLGGDEFGVCLYGRIGRDQLAERCTRIVEEGVQFADQEGALHDLTLSIGGVVLGSRAITYRTAYQQADDALYRAKAEGKNRFVVSPYEE